jgi:hypothetical protein
MTVVKIAHGRHKADAQTLTPIFIQNISNSTDGVKNLH